jgi:pyruvate/2-oxoglutarate dehydrogenase complex dihydrolipoamide acyltransferase (E2) component
MRLFTASATALLFGLFLTAPAAAQDAGTASQPATATEAALQSGLDAAVAAHTTSVDQQRAELARILSQVEVRELALAHGIDMERVESAAAALSDAQVQEVAPLVAKVTPLMQRSMGTVTISVAAIIIILLVLILVS